MWTPAKDWTPSDGIVLEANALTVATAQQSYLVTAGPGAGKTEMLAQKAAYLLETNSCTSPRRILAISFKRDAADNLKARVESRIGKELATRFDSHTFDSFAKSMVERFRLGIPEDSQPPADFDVDTDLKNTFAPKSLKKALQSVAEANAEFKNYAYLDPNNYLKGSLCRYKLLEILSPQNTSMRGAREVWLKLLEAKPCVLTFDMVKRLALLLLEQNPLVAKALRFTYPHVFLDEFQDTTYIQYDLLQASFPPGVSIMTAVGDTKQRIMIWADAIPDAFDRFKKFYSSKDTELLLNHRSDKRLVEIQRFLVEAIDSNATPAKPSTKNQAGDGICNVLEFEDEEQEAEQLYKLAKKRLTESVPLSEICILVRHSADKYVHQILETFNENGVMARVEEKYQALGRDVLVVAILGFWHLALKHEASSHWQPTLDLVCTLEGLDGMTEEGLGKAEKRIGAFLKTFKKELDAPETDAERVEELVMMVVNFMEVAKIKSVFPAHKNKSSLRYTVKKLVELLHQSLSQTDTWTEALRHFNGELTIPVMSIHKSKGLEYHTVIFVGLEDSAWFSFARQSEEERCNFFVAFSRAKKAVYFTYCSGRLKKGEKVRVEQSRNRIGSLYKMLEDAGVKRTVFKS